MNERRKTFIKKQPNEDFPHLLYLGQVEKRSVYQCSQSGNTEPFLPHLVPGPDREDE